MRFTLLAPLLLAATSVYSAAVPSRARELAGQIEQRLQLAFLDLTADVDEDDDPCPDLLVRCIKKNDDGDDEVVGDIGKQKFVHKGGLTCRQAHTKKNEAECNLKYPIKCKAQCYTQGSPL
ncbi:hypothetical protein JCM8547_005898 [Rhodosporidiobolus lusitaniae]